MNEFSLEQEIEIVKKRVAALEQLEIEKQLKEIE